MEPAAAVASTLWCSAKHALVARFDDDRFSLSLNVDAEPLYRRRLSAFAVPFFAAADCCSYRLALAKAPLREVRMRLLKRVAFTRALIGCKDIAHAMVLAANFAPSSEVLLVR